MASEIVTEEKSYVQYYVKQIKDGEITCKTYQTESEDYTPFIELTDEWEDVEDIPAGCLYIKNVVMPYTDETVDEESGNVSTEEKTCQLDFYYTYYKKSEEVEKRIKGVCFSCIYFLKGRRFRRYLCTNPKHIFKDYVTGKTFEGDCRDFNTSGECPLYESFLSEDENTDKEADEETPKDDESSTGDEVDNTEESSGDNVEQKSDT